MVFNICFEILQFNTYIPPKKFGDLVCGPIFGHVQHQCGDDIMEINQQLVPAYSTLHGREVQGDSLELMKELQEGSVNLIMTSPPFALQREKEYGNKNQLEYNDWLLQFTSEAKRVIADDGSLVIDLGGAYQKGVPIRSLYNFRMLIQMCDDQGWKLAEEFFWNNPSKLPSPIEWVNKRKIRAKDAVNTVWWLSKSDYPKADIRKCLVPYSDRMNKLLENQEKYYQPAKRPSGHDIGSAFGKDNGGAIPSNLLSFPNSESNSHYLSLCKKLALSGHPARFPSKLPEFFIKFLTDEGDTVLDIFAGSNTTGYAAESLGRNWMSFEQSHEYIANSSLRFLAGFNQEEAQAIYSRLMENTRSDLKIFRRDITANIFA